MGLRFIVVGSLDPAARRDLETFGGGSEVRGPLEAAEAIRLLLDDAADAVASSLPTFPQRLDLEFARAERYRHPVSLLAVEVDGIADLRAAQGHAAVAAYLAQIETALRRSLRGMDVIARLEDDSFGVLLPATGRDGAANVADRLRALASRVLAKPVDGGERRGLPWKTTVSVGLATAPADGVATGQQLLARAVEARRRARTAGGDRTTV